ncbi:MAG: zeta toxin, partial [Chitinophagaceae bacterium]|nr:zeta toxin [Chitinophagaceae bacterium]
LLPSILKCDIFINADEIAREIAPGEVEKVAFEAGRQMIEQINARIRERETFAFETTLSARSYRETILFAQALGYHVTLLFFWLESVEMAIDRVARRVKEGGHNIETEVIRRRYNRGIKNLFEIYIPLVSETMIYNNSFGIPELVVSKSLGRKFEIKNFEIWEKLKSQRN